MLNITDSFTIVEILIGLSTIEGNTKCNTSTTVEILIGLSTKNASRSYVDLQQ